MLDALSTAPVVLMSTTNNGARILYFTKHSAVGANYHRQREGIIACYKVMKEKYHEQTVKSVLEATNSAYIFIHTSDKIEQDSLPQMIIENKQPAWIERLEIPQKFNDIIVAKINREKW
ncbi:MAG: hypothetical protein LBB29_03150 [Holosporaceae bacterium]|nr:hypothetical protein [Holosporaceae bacterium]